jgi:hypothetical protein
MAVLFMLSRKEYPVKERAMALALFVCGFLVPAVAVAAYLSAHGALSDMASQVFVFGASYGGQYYHGGLKVLGLAVWKILAWAANYGFLVAGAALGAGLSARRKERGWKLLFWFGLGLFLNILVQLKFFDYHFMVLLLPLSIFTGVFFGRHFANLDSEKTGAAKSAVLALAALLLVANLRPDAGRYLREGLYDLGMISQEDFLEKYGKYGVGDLSAAASYKVARYLREHTEPSDKVLVFSLEPGLNFLARRAAPTRFCYDLPLVYEFGGARLKSYQARIRKEFLAGLAADAPAYVVVVEKDTNTVEPKDSFEQMREFVEFRSFLEHNYLLETKIEHYYLYRKQ